MKTPMTLSRIHIGSRNEDAEYSVAATDGLHRSIALFKAFRTEQSDPNRFYRLQADDAVRQVSRHVPIQDATVFDVGGGVGYSTDAFRKAGARCVLVEPYARALRADKNQVLTGGAAGKQYRVAVASDRAVSSGCVIGDGFQLPFADATADVSFSSNVLEHIENHQSFISELVRVTKPNGIIYVSFTNWYSPWGGHETAPWHYLGGEWAGRMYRRRTGCDPIHQFGESLFPVHVGPLLRWIDRWNKVEIVETAPRYYPSWCNWLVRVPVLREVATWNLLLLLRKRPLTRCESNEDFSNMSSLEAGISNGRGRNAHDAAPYAS